MIELITDLDFFAVSRFPIRNEFSRPIPPSSELGEGLGAPVAEFKLTRGAELTPKRPGAPATRRHVCQTDKTQV